MSYPNSLPPISSLDTFLLWIPSSFLQHQQFTQPPDGASHCQFLPPKSLKMLMEVI